MCGVVLAERLYASYIVTVAGRSSLNIWGLKVFRMRVKENLDPYDLRNQM